MSVPNQYAADGGRSRFAGDTASGSTVPSHGASSAIATIATRITPPTIAIGWRRNASRKRRHVGDTERATPSDAAGSAVAMSSIANARVEQRVGQVDRQVHEHVYRREDQRDALDDRVVAAQDRVDGEPPD